MGKEHLDYIDQLKGFAIILVVWGHCGWSYFYDTLYYLHLPVFIMVTGMLLRHRENYKSPFMTVRKLCGTLMYPFLMFGLISIFVFACMNSTAHTEFSLLYRVREIITLGYDACWFLPALFIGQSIAVYIIFWAKRGEKEYRVISCGMIVILLTAEVLRHVLWRNYSSSSMNSFIDGKAMWLLLIGSRSLMFTFFVLVGYMIFPGVERIRHEKKAYFSVLGAVTLAIMIFVTRRAGFVDLRLVKWDNTVIYLSCSLLISLSVIVFFSSLPVKSRLLAFLGKNSLIIMGVHMSMQRVWLAGRLLEKYAPGSLAEMPTIYSLMHMLLTFVLTVPEIYVFEKAFPFMTNWQILKQLCARNGVGRRKYEKE